MSREINTKMGLDIYILKVNTYLNSACFNTNLLLHQRSYLIFVGCLFCCLVDQTFPCLPPGYADVELIFSDQTTSRATAVDETHYNDVIMGAIASQITSLTIVYSTVYSGADQRKYESSASLAFVPEIHRGPVNCPHKWPVTREMFPFDDVIMMSAHYHCPVW